MEEVTEEGGDHVGDTTSASRSGDHLINSWPRYQLSCQILYGFP